MKSTSLIIPIMAVFLQISVAFPSPPVLLPMPDIIIGDADEPGFWTVDVNMFRFPNAFKFNDCVIHNDPSILKWCFIEDPLQSGALEINGKLALNPSTEDPSAPPAAKDVRAGNETTSFRDILASPHSYDSQVLAGVATYPGEPKCDQFITFWVSEPVQQKADSETIYVKSIDGISDRLSGTSQFVREWGFDTGTQGWTYSNVTGFSLPLPQSTGGTIGLQSPTGGNVFGFWQTPNTAVAYEANALFRARYWLSRGAFVTNPDDTPQIRLRWTTRNFTGSAACYINSIAPFNMVPPIAPSTKEYRSYYYPPNDTGRLGVAFDLLDFSDTESGAVLLDRVVIEKIYSTDLGSPTTVRTFDTDFDTWEINLNFGGAFGSVATTVPTNDRIVLTSTIPGSQASFAQSPLNALTYEGTAHLYRASFNISRDGSDAMTFPYVRLRAFNEDNQIVAEYNINHGDPPGNGAPPQTPATKPFEVYWETPDLPGSPTSDQDGFRLAFDLLDFSDIEGDTAYLERVDIDFFSIPFASVP